MAPQLPAGTFLGASRRSQRTASFSFTQSEYGIGLRLPPHSHEHAHFCLVLDGHYQERIGPREFERTANTLVYYPPDTTHAESHLKPGRHLLIELLPDVLEQLGGASHLQRQPLEVSTGRLVDSARRIGQEIQLHDEAAPLAMEALGLELLVGAFRWERERDTLRPPTWLSRVDEILCRGLCEAPSLAEVASQLGVHPAHLARTHRRFRRCTVGERLRQLRVEFARRLLEETELPVTAIAQRAGFCDQSHLTRSFRALTGVTPARYRARLRRSCADHNDSN
jgi:AraC-like DNA-binding protein/quercetin dioxygenase-like cupin family protein